MVLAPSPKIMIANENELVPKSSHRANLSAYSVDEPEKTSRRHN